MEVSQGLDGFQSGQNDLRMVKRRLSESGGKSWPKQISIAARQNRGDLPNKNAASPRGSGVFSIMTGKEENSLSLAGLAATYSPRA
jgi:hypothetical protein